MRTQLKVFKIPAPTHIELVLNKWLEENEHILINGMYMLNLAEVVKINENQIRQEVGFYIVVAYSFEEWRDREFSRQD